MATEFDERAAESRVRGARAVHDNLVLQNKTTRAAVFATERKLKEVAAELEKQQAALAKFEAEVPVMARAREVHVALLTESERVRADLAKAEARLQAVIAEAKRSETNLDSILADLAAMKETV